MKGQNSKHHFGKGQWKQFGGSNEGKDSSSVYRAEEEPIAFNGGTHTLRDANNGVNSTQGPEDLTIVGCHIEGRHKILAQAWRNFQVYSRNEHANGLGRLWSCNSGVKHEAGRDTVKSGTAPEGLKQCEEGPVAYCR